MKTSMKRSLQFFMVLACCIIFDICINLIPIVIAKPFSIGLTRLTVFSLVLIEGFCLYVGYCICRAVFR